MANPHAWQLETPTADGQVLLWPDARQWGRMAEQTHRRLEAESAGRLLDLPLPDARRLARRSLPAFSGPAVDVEGLWFVTGHQTFPYHAGVWAKSAASYAAAAGAGGLAVNLNVDHDLPHAGPQLSWPAVQPDGRVIRRGDLELDHRQPFERQPAPSPQQSADVCRQVARDLDALLTEGRTCPFLLDGRPGVRESWLDREHFGGWFAQARAQLDETLGLRMIETLSSRLAGQDAFLLFVADAIRRADLLHPAYNQAVAACEQLTGRAPAVPLRIEGERIELPFWTLRPDAPGRHRLFVAAGGDFTLSDDRGVIGQIGQADLGAAERAIDRLRQVLAGQDVQLRPRALTLTLFARMLLADLFIHGIGGAAYEYAADVLLERHYGLAAPPFAVASATLLLPLDVATATAEQFRQARRRLRDMHFNPQRHLPADLLANPATRDWVADKWASVERNARLRDGELTEVVRRQRHGLFVRVRELNAQLAGLLGEPIRRQVELVAQLARRQQAGQVVLARDYFYGLFPTAKLQRLRETIEAVASG